MRNTQIKTKNKKSGVNFKKASLNKKFYSTKSSFDLKTNTNLKL